MLALPRTTGHMTGACGGFAITTTLLGRLGQYGIGGGIYGCDHFDRETVAQDPSNSSPRGAP
jgi:hypothetical protein